MIVRWLKIAVCLVVFSHSLDWVQPQDTSNTNSNHDKETNQDVPIQLGNFSVSLAVKDLQASKTFYEKLDFKPIGGNATQNWLIMQNGTTTIGLFEGMFEKNILTFNPGWNHKSETLPEFQDVRELQAILKARGIELSTEADATSSDPASFVITDPDGNPILVDQHVPKPTRNP
jgi:catechol 2,3-dioxygenase-like lactoylglutathione lyase family enzyme